MSPEERYKQAVVLRNELALKNANLGGQKRDIYHGTNSLFDKFNFERGGGMVHFAEDPSVAQTYSLDLGSGSRNAKKWTDVRVEDVDSGASFTYDTDKKLWTSSDGSEIFHFDEFKEMMDEGDRYFEAYPKDARIIHRKADMGRILDTYPDNRKNYYERANKKGLEAVIDIIDPSKIENKVNPQFNHVSQRYAQRLRNSAIEELKAVPGAPGFGNTLWGTSKRVAGDEIREALSGVSSQIKNAGFDGIKFQDDSHPTIAMFKDPELPFSIKKTGSKLGKVLPFVGTALGAAGALSYSDMAGAAVDAVVPGGVEEMGADEEQRELDRRYRERIRQRTIGD